MPADKDETLAAFSRHRVSAIIRTDSAGSARRAMQAAVEGGFRLVEFTLTTPDAFDLIAEFTAIPDVLVGAGTVLAPDQARAAVQAGARFIVSPVCDPEVIVAANEVGAVTIPGTFTPTEMMAAHRAGADMMKLFPAPGIGPDYVRSILGPMPFLRIFPTNGITMDNFLDYLTAGAFGVGFTADLFRPQDIAAERYDAIRRRAADVFTRLN